LFVPLLFLFILKVWRVTPADFQPVVKVSGLDLVQASSLRRAAIQHAALGRFEEAFQSWRIAVANNPGNPELIRGSLRHLMQRMDSRKYSQIVMGYSSWLLRLTQTNVADLELTAKAFETYRLNDMLVYTLAPLESQLTPPLHAAYLKALFNRGEISQFANRWERLQKHGVKFSDPELDVYHAAYLAGWGPHLEIAEAKHRLEQAKQNAAQRTVAHRLQLKVSEQLVQVDTYQESLEVLQDQRLDTLTDQVGLWQLLAMSGRKAEAVRLLREHVRPPASGEEAVVLAKAHFDLGFPDEAREVLKRYAPEFTDSETVWLSYANLLIQQQHWEDLFQEAIQLRHEAHPLRDRLNGFSYYLQGIAEAHRNRRENAREAFQKLRQAKIRNKLWELSAAETIERLGFSDIARELLLDIQKDVPNTPDYWLLLAKTAYEAKDPNLLVTAMSSAYKLRPDDYLVMNNYAAALLSTREQPEQALQLTSRVLQRTPDLPASRINHGLALLQNQKFSEAEALLKTLDPNELRDQDLTYFHFAVFELNFNGRHYELARQHSEKIELQYLLPTERQWLDKTRQNMEAQTSTATQKS
jgi:predicted Zn-dependent protease